MSIHALTMTHIVHNTIVGHPIRRNKGARYGMHRERITVEAIASRTRSVSVSTCSVPELHGIPVENQGERVTGEGGGMAGNGFMAKRGYAPLY